MERKPLKSLFPRLISVELGTFEDWVATTRSDHVPMVVDLEGN
jgi:hypothetical protein